jgi:formylglycine-generating enzyme required for sulfatase activity/energy-coupling factor transporter ATP-binding protein EcfA2
MKKLIKPLIVILLLVLVLVMVSRYSDIIVGWANQLWGLDDAQLDKINKWTGILADGGTVVAVVGGLIWGFLVWPWKSRKPDDGLTDVGKIKTDREFLAEYRRYIRETYKHLDFTGIEDMPETVNNTSGLLLESVYVPLRARLDLPSGESWHRFGGRFFCGTKAHAGEDVPAEIEQATEQAEQAAMPIEQWIEQQQALVILGDPGSGKSTSLKHFALSLAQEKTALLPILLPLNAYGTEFAKQPLSFEAFLPEYFHVKRPQLDKVRLTKLFTEALTQQKAFILMDGLDEVGSNRGQVVAQVESFVQRWVADPESNIKSGNRMVVTSRFVGYRDYPLVDPRWKTVAISDWNLEEIGQFFSKFTLAAELAWSGGENNETARQKAVAEQQALQAVVQQNKGIRRLAGNPLLSSLLALIKRQGVNLPDRRVKLYELYMGTLLRSWHRKRNLDRQCVGVEEDAATYGLLAKLALHLRLTNPQHGLITEDAMQSYLRKHYQEDNYSREAADRMAATFLHSVHNHSNLLIERGYQQYGFIHLTFEEYLAGFALAKEDVATLQQKIPLYLQTPKQWKETLLLAMGVIAVIKTEREKANAVLSYLLTTGKPEHGLFVGEVLNDVGASQLGNRMTVQVQDYLSTLMQDANVAMPDRANAGRILGEVGDERPGIIVKKVNGEPIYRQRGSKKYTIPDIDWQKIPAGTFRMGTEGDEGYDDEKPVHEVSLPTFFISRYPVTNAQYRSFVEAGLYEDNAFWHEKLPTAAKLWFGGEMVGEKLVETIAEKYRENYRNWLKQDKDRRKPYYWTDKKWNQDNHPVVGVSWFEALAYSVWLNSLLSDLKPDGVVDNVQIRLPTEAEWEYAARGHQGLRYAWGNDADAKRGNYADTKIGQTSAVGMFPPGKAFGLHDMTGNVWEWTSSRWGGNANNPDFKYDQWDKQEFERNLLAPVEFRVIRGGSWDGTSDYVRCAFRDRNLPNYRNFNIGFRLVLGS